jgi:putative tryptophan/tyrosine transport system substrate-binding protein
LKPAFRTPLTFEPVISACANVSNVGLILPPDFTTVVNRAQVIELTSQYRLPAIYPFRLFVTSGGLISYGINLRDMYVKAASYFDRILREDIPENLPVQTPTKFELVINLNVAKALWFNSAAHTACPSRRCHRIVMDFR